MNSVIGRPPRTLLRRLCSNLSAELVPSRLGVGGRDLHCRGWDCPGSQPPSRPNTVLLSPISRLCCSVSKAVAVVSQSGFDLNPALMAGGPGISVLSDVETTRSPCREGILAVCGCLEFLNMRPQILWTASWLPPTPPKCCTESAIVRQRGSVCSACGCRLALR